MIKLSDSPFYHLVPKGLAENARFRQRILEMCRDDPVAQKDQWIACKRDLLYWINTFCWIFEPREERDDYRVIPFITYPFQDSFFTEMNETLGKDDIGIEKSRDMGASWGFLTIFKWRFIFREMQSFMVVSRKEDLVDKSGDPDCLFWKLDFLRTWLPEWMQPSVKRIKLHMANLDKGSVIDGSSTTGDVGRGGRRLAIGLDEYAAFDIDDGYEVLAATQPNTNTRIFTSTPCGSAGAFYDKMHEPPGVMKKFTLHWTIHPIKNQGHYRAGPSHVEMLDKRMGSAETASFLRDYPFVRDGKDRSPWYDKECLRMPIPTMIARELDISYSSSDYPFYDEKMIEDLVDKYGREPWACGDLGFDPDALEPRQFTEADGGLLKLWANLNADGNPVEDRRYVIGADVSAGTGASNSCLVVWDWLTNEKVAEYSSAKTGARELAWLAVALCRWFKGESGEGARLIWEAPGPGRTFGKVVLENGYSNIYYRERNEKAVKAVSSDIPGFWPGEETKLALHDAYRAALKEERAINRSIPALRECKQFRRTANGGVIHRSSAKMIDPSGAKHNHGDVVTADALALLLLEERRTKRQKNIPAKIPANCVAARHQRYFDGQKEKGTW